MATINEFLNALNLSFSMELVNSIREELNEIFNVVEDEYDYDYEEDYDASSYEETNVCTYISFFPWEETNVSLEHMFSRLSLGLKEELLEFLEKPKMLPHPWFGDSILVEKLRYYHSKPRVCRVLCDLYKLLRSEIHSLMEGIDEKDLEEWGEHLLQIDFNYKISYFRIAYFVIIYHRVYFYTLNQIGEYLSSPQYQIYCQKRAKAVTIQPDKKWKQGLYPYQQLFKLFVAQGYNKLKYAINILPDEWKSGKVGKATMLYLGVKGSPKISKVLLALGLSEKMVSIALGAGKVAASSNKTKATTIRSDKQSFLEQGNSVYYSSCQATDPRAVWSGGTQHNRVSGDLPHIGDTLFMWTIGAPMSQDGKGFVCRAKLRVIFKPTTNQVLGLYRDRVYGNRDLLMEYIHELEEWWTIHSINKYGVRTPVFMESSSSPKPTKFWSPSSVSGYQDTLEEYNYMYIGEISDTKKSLLYQAYCSRQKVGGCYLSPLKEVRYNPQNGKFS